MATAQTTVQFVLTMGGAEVGHGERFEIPGAETTCRVMVDGDPNEMFMPWTELEARAGLLGVTIEDQE